MKRTERASETEQERMCIVTRAVRPPSEMIRFVLAPDDTIVADLKRNLPGRGVWVEAVKSRVAEAAARNLFAKGLKAKALVSPSLADDVERLLEHSALQSLSICNKAGLVTAGSAKVEKAISSGPVAALVHAADGGADGIRKVGQALTRAYGEAARFVPKVVLFASPQLDLALGRSNVIHAALRCGAASEAFLERCRRLAHYRGGSGVENGSGSAGFGLPDVERRTAEAGAEDRNRRGGGPDHCQDDRPGQGSGANVMTSGHGPGIETI